LPALCSVLRIRSLEAVVQQSKGQDQPFSFAQKVLQIMDIDYQLDASSDQIIPSNGPLVIVSNHPFGGLEALILCSIFRTIRHDLKFIANSYLTAFPDLREVLIPVNPFGYQKTRNSNLTGIRQALKWVHNGGALCIFPAGEVSHWQARKGKILDPVWQSSAIRLILRAKADVLPVFFHGANSRLFQYMGLIHPRLRTALLPTEFLRSRNRRFSVSIRSPIPKRLIAHLPSEKAASWYLRARTYGFSTSSFHLDTLRKLRTWKGVLLSGRGEIATPLSSELILQDLKGLKKDQLLVTSGDFMVFEAEAKQIPHLLHEIGRQREITFRREGEGAKKALDLDLFDQFYDHLILWDSQKQELAGAYRLGRVDHLLTLKNGVKNLYTSTLFRFQKDFFQQRRASIELGRSFITPEYQKGYSPLLLLWKGIGQYILKRPHYRYLFGPVSISQTYDNISIQSLITHLRCKFSQPDLACKVRGKTRPRLKFNGFERMIIESIGNLETSDLDSFIYDMQNGLMGMPVLLRQYLKLGGKITDFHHDKRFGSFDGLIIVDLLQTEYKILSKFMGKDRADAYLAYHARPANKEQLTL
jgi:putative hemolysin